MTLAPRGLAFPLVLFCTAACTPSEPLSCGPGTIRSGDQCVAQTGRMMPPAGSDAGMPISDPPRTDDAGSGWSTTPPSAPPTEPGCDMAAGECAAWADELVALIAAHPGRGCGDALTRPDGVQGIADRHARHQAGIDAIDSSSPDGDLFDQIRASEVAFSNAGALFSVGRIGAADVMGRWVEGDDTRSVLDQCWTMSGVSFATGESGWSYATVLLAR